ncbi:MAG: N-acetyltransferase [Blastocatellia bacterium]
MSQPDRSAAISIRRATPDDAAMLVELGTRTFYAAFRNACSAEDMQLYLSTWFTLEQVTNELHDQQSLFLIAEVAGAPAGYAKMQAGETPDCISDPQAIELSRLYVEQQHLGSGVGPALMQACLDEAGQRGHRTVYLGVWEDNHRAQAFYRKWGFEKVGEHIFMMGNDAQTDWWMERAL